MNKNDGLTKKIKMGFIKPKGSKFDNTSNLTFVVETDPSLNFESFEDLVKYIETNGEG